MESHPDGRLNLPLWPNPVRLPLLADGVHVNLAQIRLGPVIQSEPEPFGQIRYIVNRCVDQVERQPLRTPEPFAVGVAQPVGTHQPAAFRRFASAARAISATTGSRRRSNGRCTKPGVTRWR